jgi:major membrane immunogen (membrane-anchored lipoprotein)
MESDGFCGFRIKNGTLYATEGNENAYTDHEIIGITVTENHVYRVVYDYETSKIEYYVDGIKKHTTTDLSEMAVINCVYSYYIRRDVEAQRVLTATDLIIEIEK